MSSLKEKTVSLIKEIYKKYQFGGALHIVLDDVNISEFDILWCLRNTVQDEVYQDDRTLFEECALNLLKMPTDQERIDYVCLALGEIELSATLNTGGN